MRMSEAHCFERSTDLAAPATAVWAHATSVEGINAEFRPFLKMTFPAGIDEIDPADVPLGRRFCRCWILLFGMVPVDYDDLTFVEIEPGRRFLERSSTSTQSVWEHERIVEERPGGSRLIDRIRYEPRLPLLGPVHRWIFEFVFDWRHRQLRQRFGG